MIQQIDLYQHIGGRLITGEGVPYGLYLYRDIGQAEGYKPWDKVRVVEVYYSKSRKNFLFGKRTPKTGIGKGSRRAIHESVGIPTPLFKEFVEAATILLNEMSGNPPSTTIPVAAPKVATEQDRVDTLINEMGIKRL